MLGACVGDVEGEADIVGAADGDTEGEAEGDTLGETVGDSVGAGESLGPAVALGPKVGKLVVAPAPDTGISVLGAAVGLFVPPPFPVVLVSVPIRCRNPFIAIECA